MSNHENFGFRFCMLPLFLVGLVFFLNGFFPITHEKYNTTVGRPSSIGLYNISQPTKQFSRTVLMIVDAIRYDFFNESNMPFAFKNACMKLKLRVDIPTVTLPRIKSLIGGTLSSFSDIVLNLGKADQMEDSLLHRIRMNGDVAIFAGDKIWVNLFPNMFQRQKVNMDSFFLKDFYEGDTNVTKTILQELKNTDWNMLIAHYLGLDHIGHVEGSTSPKIILKLREMDEVIGKIHTFENMTNGILLVTGDHGMRNGGGHGGTTAEELYVPLLVFQKSCVLKSPKSNIKEFKQIDLTPTLAMLMSSEIPKQSIGCILPDLIKHMSLEDQLYVYHYNAMHLLKRAYNRFGHSQIENSDFYAWLTSGKQMHIDFLRFKRTEDMISSLSFEKSKQEYIRASTVLSNKLVESMGGFKYELITVGIILSTLITISILISTFFVDSMEHYFPCIKQLMVNVGIASCLILVGKLTGYTETNPFLCCLLVMPISASICIFQSISKGLLRFLLSYAHARHNLTLPIPPLACFLFPSFSLASTSFIEEEHQTWYYFGSTLLIALCIRNFTINISQRRIMVEELKTDILQKFWCLRWYIIVLAIIALLRKLNQTGDKWKHLQDFGDILNQQDNAVWLSAFFGLGLIILIFFLRDLTTPLQFVTSIVALLLIYCYRGVSNGVLFFNFNSSIFSYTLACFWICLIIIAINRLYYIKFALYDQKCGQYKPYSTVIGILKTNLTCSLLISALLHKPHNVILLFCMIFTLQETFLLCDRLQKQINWKHSGMKVLTYKTAITFVISKMFYFYQGNSNSLATIDLNPGYIGQKSYNPFLASIFVTFNTYNAQINAYLYLLMHVYMNYIDCKGIPHADMTGVVTTEKCIKIVTSFFTAATMLPTTIYLFLLILFRNHLFIYSVFAPKALYECFNTIILFLNCSLTYFYLKLSR